MPHGTHGTAESQREYAARHFIHVMEKEKAQPPGHRDGVGGVTDGDVADPEAGLAAGKAGINDIIAGTHGRNGFHDAKIAHWKKGRRGIEENLQKHGYLTHNRAKTYQAYQRTFERREASTGEINGQKRHGTG